VNLSTGLICPCRYASLCGRRVTKLRLKSRTSPALATAGKYLRERGLDHSGGPRLGSPKMIWWESLTI
jgi:hypothetical protein